MAEDIQLTRIDDPDLAARAVRRIRGGDPTGAERFLEGAGNVAYAAMEGDDPVAWAYGFVLDRPDGARMMLLYEMEVRPAWRRQGIGRRLVEVFRREAVEAGCRTMWLITDIDNVEAQMFYQLEGAKSEGARLQFAWRGLDAGQTQG